MDGEKKKKPVRIGKIIDGIFDQHKQKQQSPQSLIMNNWKIIVNSEDVAKNSRPVLIKNKTLIIEVSNSALLHHLTLCKKNILEIIKKLVKENAVQDIRFKIGDKNVS
jgi:predicted nucleic acid-binding Zn ribbon protein